ncbi:hypothetical protein HDU67_005294 [Dinochytrium kinnereticum]|nr:hypothetical protein HDU67_005294 [Dinochytrium kinnereticum]
MVKNHMAKKVISCLKAEDEETQYWALSLLHDLASHAECHEEFLSADGLDLIIRMTSTSNFHISLYISDIFVFLCSKIRERIETSNILSSVFSFLRSSEEDLQYSGALLLLNLSALSEHMLMRVIDEGALKAIKDTLISTIREDIQAVLAKILITIVRKKPDMCSLVLEDVLYPLVLRVNSLYQDKDAISGLIGSLYTVQIILQSYGMLKDFQFPPALAAQILKLSTYAQGFLCKRLSSSLVHLPPILQELEDILPDYYETDPVVLKNIATRSAASLTAIHQLFHNHLDVVRILTLLVKLIENDESLLLQALMSFASAITKGASLLIIFGPHMAIERLPAPRQSVIDSNLVMPVIADILSKSHEPSIHFYSQLICDRVADFSMSYPCESLEHSHLDRGSMTPYISISHDGFEIRNDSWTFESVRAIRSASLHGKYCFEVELRSSSIVQVGWVNSDWKFDPEGGEGVGDDNNSYAYDGFRQRKWHGTLKSNAYGDPWKAGDVVTALLDLDECVMSFMLNGQNLGVAFMDIPQDLSWFPAVSIAAGQGCKLFFGSDLHPLRYAPAGYTHFGGSIHSDPTLKLGDLSVEVLSEHKRESNETSEDREDKETVQRNEALPDEGEAQDTSLLVSLDELGLSPSISFSITIDFDQMCDREWQFGLYDSEKNFILLVEKASGNSSISKSLDSDISLEPMDIDAMLCQVEVLCFIKRISPQVGDTLTCSYYNSANTVIFKINDRLLGSVDSNFQDTNNLFPFHRNFRHPRCNLQAE